MLIFLSGCAYRNPLDGADFRFQTLPAPPYMLSGWYRVSEVGAPLTVYVEKPEMDEAQKKAAAKDKSANVAYLGRPCQYFKTAVCNKPINEKNAEKALQKGIQQLKKKAGAKEVILKGMDE